MFSHATVQLQDFPHMTWCLNLNPKPIRPDLGSVPSASFRDRGCFEHSFLGFSGRVYGPRTTIRIVQVFRLNADISLPGYLQNTKTLNPETQKHPCTPERQPLPWPFQATPAPPNRFVVSLHWAFQTQGHLFLVLDYCSGGPPPLWAGLVP